MLKIKDHLMKTIKNQHTNNQKEKAIENNIKIKGLANMFEGKIGMNQVRNFMENSVPKENAMDDKLKKLYGKEVEYEKEIEIEDDEEDVPAKNDTKTTSKTGKDYYSGYMTVKSY